MYNYGSATEHKVFISYYHEEDQRYKNYIDTHLSAGIINKSVQSGDINTDNSDEYIKRLIREDYISDASVVIVLIGPKTKTRKHVDWEIYAGLRASLNGSAGLLGIMLPELKVSSDGKYFYDDMPERFADNARTGYAEIYNWEYAKSHFINIIETAFNNRITLRDKINNSRVQKSYNTTGY